MHSEKGCIFCYVIPAGYGCGDESFYYLCSAGAFMYSLIFTARADCFYLFSPAQKLGLSAL